MSMIIIIFFFLNGSLCKNAFLIMVLIGSPFQPDSVLNPSFSLVPACSGSQTDLKLTLLPKRHKSNQASLMAVTSLLSLKPMVSPRPT